MKDVTGVVELTSAEIIALLRYTGRMRVVDCDDYDIQDFISARKQIKATLKELEETSC